MRGWHTSWQRASPPSGAQRCHPCCAPNAPIGAALPLAASSLHHPTLTSPAPAPDAERLARRTPRLCGSVIAPDPEYQVMSHLGRDAQGLRAEGTAVLADRPFKACSRREWGHGTPPPTRFPPVNIAAQRAGRAAAYRACCRPLPPTAPLRCRLGSLLAALNVVNICLTPTTSSFAVTQLHSSQAAEHRPAVRRNAGAHARAARVVGGARGRAPTCLGARLPAGLWVLSFFWGGQASLLRVALEAVEGSRGGRPVCKRLQEHCTAPPHRPHILHPPGYALPIECVQEQEAEYSASLAAYYAARRQHQADQQRLNQVRGGWGQGLGGCCHSCCLPVGAEGCHPTTTPMPTLTPLPPSPLTTGAVREWHPCAPAAAAAPAAILPPAAVGRGPDPPAGLPAAPPAAPPAARRIHG